MVSSRTHLITYFLPFLIPFAVSLTFNFTNFGLQNQNGDIVIEGQGATITDGEIQLTQNVSHQAGRATYFRPLHLWDRKSNELASFTTNFTFVIDSNWRGYYGDGLTFFLAQSNNSETYTGQNIETATQFVAVEFDTFWNVGWDPIVGRDIRMGDHVGISISSLSSVRTEKWFSNVPGGGVCQAWIKYDSDLKNLSVSFTGFQNNTSFRQDGLYYIVDLSQVLPEWVTFGFSAATGALNQNNKVRAWAFDSSNLPGDEINEVPQIPIPDLVKGKNIKVSLVVGLAVGIMVTVTLLFLLVFAFLWKKKKNIKEEAKETGFDVVLKNEYQMGAGPKRFSYHELAQSTNDFAENNKLGEGGFGGVYQGFLAYSNTYVAVKRVSKSSKQGINEYASEVRIISRLRHRSLVQLMGWCHEKGNLLLVYQYMENGSLDSHLFKEKSLLTWGTRYKIVNGLASALLYLHEEWEQCVLHRDIKSSNVMLDLNFNAKLGDFGLATLVDHEKGAQTTKLAGTLGYMAPECVVTGKATKESDVFSFGVVVLEIACGRRPIEYKAQGNQIWLLEWIWELYGAGKVLEAVDPRLGSDFDEEEIKHMIIMGLWCVHPDSKVRPSMRQVIQVLNAEASVPIFPSKMVISSYWKPPVVKNHSSCVVSNKDSSNKSLLVGR
ncbi:putative protein kinase RLK-Pelle-L-LEC family [Helianthus annuus]|uniref:non-specific serine/threonine protein kinase n=1 Tax=Helianthus annuus TaxID=4232 RepID=A0A251RVA4_HELAN|nr:L-type lectin-domain containing receptor kinase IX.1 [Helianthus annuus]KAF5788905.1 putative protein kinase RLK-Pelle-L-LEC family [Helianthus annuus]KAJ0540706.1 putative protein kinase RLK-Pelle-L-LEC family [Helianthus annuus]KAJ0886160.1 putative protein kinase RLK-Pelle-L-LEC family [Helianthus annuus]